MPDTKFPSQSSEDFEPLVEGTDVYENRRATEADIAEFEPHPKLIEWEELIELPRFKSELQRFNTELQKLRADVHDYEGMKGDVASHVKIGLDIRALRGIVNDMRREFNASGVDEAHLREKFKEFTDFIDEIDERMYVNPLPSPLGHGPNRSRILETIDDFTSKFGWTTGEKEEPAQEDETSAEIETKISELRSEIEKYEKWVDSIPPEMAGEVRDYLTSFIETLDETLEADVSEGKEVTFAWARNYLDVLVKQLEKIEGEIAESHLESHPIRTPEGAGESEVSAKAKELQTQISEFYRDANAIQLRANALPLPREETDGIWGEATGLIHQMNVARASGDQARISEIIAEGKTRFIDLDAQLLLLENKVGDGSAEGIQAMEEREKEARRRFEDLQAEFRKFGPFTEELPEKTAKYDKPRNLAAWEKIMGEYRAKHKAHDTSLEIQYLLGTLKKLPDDAREQTFAKINTLLIQYEEDLAGISAIMGSPEPIQVEPEIEPATPVEVAERTRLVERIDELERRIVALPVAERPYLRIGLQFLTKKFEGAKRIQDPNERMIEFERIGKELDSLETDLHVAELKAPPSAPPVTPETGAVPVGAPELVPGTPEQPPAEPFSSPSTPEAGTPQGASAEIDPATQARLEKIQEDTRILRTRADDHLHLGEQLDISEREVRRAIASGLPEERDRILNYEEQWLKGVMAGIDSETVAGGQAESQPPQGEPNPNLPPISDATMDRFAGTPRDEQPPLDERELGQRGARLHERIDALEDRTNDSWLRHELNNMRARIRGSLDATTPEAEADILGDVEYFLEGYEQYSHAGKLGRARFKASRALKGMSDKFDEINPEVLRRFMADINSPREPRPSPEVLPPIGREFTDAQSQHLQEMARLAGIHTTEADIEQLQQQIGAELPGKVILKALQLAMLGGIKNPENPVAKRAELKANTIEAGIGMVAEFAGRSLGAPLYIPIRTGIRVATTARIQESRPSYLLERYLVAQRLREQKATSGKETTREEVVRKFKKVSESLERVLVEKLYNLDSRRATIASLLAEFGIGFDANNNLFLANQETGTPQESLTLQDISDRLGHTEEGQPVKPLKELYSQLHILGLLTNWRKEVGTDTYHELYVAASAAAFSGPRDTLDFAIQQSRMARHEIAGRSESGKLELNKGLALSTTLALVQSAKSAVFFGAGAFGAEQIAKIDGLGPFLQEAFRNPTGIPSRIKDYWEYLSNWKFIVAGEERSMTSQLLIFGLWGSALAHWMVMKQKAKSKPKKPEVTQTDTLKTKTSIPIFREELAEEPTTETEQPAVEATQLNRSEPPQTASPETPEPAAPPETDLELARKHKYTPEDLKAVSKVMKEQHEKAKREGQDSLKIQNEKHRRAVKINLRGMQSLWRKANRPNKKLIQAYQEGLIALADELNIFSDPDEWMNLLKTYEKR